MTTTTVNHISGIQLKILRDTVRGFQAGPESRTSDSHGLGAIRHEQTLESQPDEAVDLAGDDNSANPVEHLLNALAACLTATMVAHAAAHGIQIEELGVALATSVNLRSDLTSSSKISKRNAIIHVHFKVTTAEQNIEKLKELAVFSTVFDRMFDGVKFKLQVERISSWPPS